jgi:hypothetical protein
MRNLDPQKTVYINCDKKSLPFRGWKGMYNEENKNYIKTSNALDIMKYIRAISDKTDKEIIIVDTISSIMSDKEMSERKKKGYDIILS